MKKATELLGRPIIGPFALNEVLCKANAELANI